MELKIQQRIALGTFFLVSGLSFATWASRIPTIKTFFDLNDAELGTVLLAMPVSSLIGLPISGWLVSKFDSRKPLLASFTLFNISLIFIGFVKSTFFLIVGISLFSFFMRILNISMNTQSIILQREFKKRIVGSFHGLWSVGGLIGVAFSTIMVKLNVHISTHLLIVSIFSILLTFTAYFFVIKNDKSPTGNKLIFGKPDTFILYLGLIIFLAAICEGGMFDWSGVYFKEVIKEEVFTYGYLSFMACMAFSRFFSDKLITKIGSQKTYIFSAIVITTGILTAILFPFFWAALIGFCLVGFGTAAIFPMTFALAGTSKKYSPGMAISIISTYGILGMFIGPPLIGYLSHAFGLKNAFLIFAVIGILIIPISRQFFKSQKTNKK
ncbi:MFS transporter [Lutibacter sp. TH_r2]|uniref:MFS transporter n=1 Tax=Lutibacter sp. TH_r2 TaxID=3082083 RepID=UPI00295320E0|nr:MFS transporter [Lutibacter sp. TH_r2]MDV7187680.1 MFS transporter [Lutibacter sp. TH_r2]